MTYDTMLNNPYNDEPELMSSETRVEPGSCILGQRGHYSPHLLDRRLTLWAPDGNGWYLLVFKLQLKPLKLFDDFHDSRQQYLV